MKDFGPFRYPSVQQAGSVRSAAASYHFPSDPSSLTLGSSQSTSDAEKLDVVARWNELELKVEAILEEVEAGKMDDTGTKLAEALRMGVEADRAGASDPTWWRIQKAKADGLAKTTRVKIEEVDRKRNEAKFGTLAAPEAHGHEVRELNSLLRKVKTLKMSPSDPSTIPCAIAWAGKLLEEDRHAPEDHQRALGRAKLYVKKKKPIESLKAAEVRIRAQAMTTYDQLLNEHKDDMDASDKKMTRRNTKKAMLEDRLKDAMAQEKQLEGKIHR